MHFFEILFFHDFFPLTFGYSEFRVWIAVVKIWSRGKASITFDDKVFSTERLWAVASILWVSSLNIMNLQVIAIRKHNNKITTKYKN